MYLLKDKDILLYVTNRNGNISIDKPLLFENKEDAEKLNAELGNNWIVTTKEEAVNKLKKRQIERFKCCANDRPRIRKVLEQTI